MSFQPDPAVACNGAYSELVRGGFDEAQVEAAAERAHQRLDGKASIAFLFVSCDYADSLKDIVELVQIHARCPMVVGCSAAGFIGVAREEEDGSGFSLLVLRLAQTEMSILELPTESEGSAWERAKRWNREGCTGWILPATRCT
jgi:small ligand-binding sensory domain FIST